ncbi:MAG: acyl-CoA thioesterase [Gammaproteobacteria bacterium]|jgi:acyl-CoA thioesterase YciA
MNPENGVVDGRAPVMRVPATPQAANAGGDIFGGWLMGQIDIAGSIPAVLLAKGRVVTAAVNYINFRKPLYIGDMVNLYAEVSRVGHTSIGINVEVIAQRHRDGEIETVAVADAGLTYVAVDADGKPRPVPERLHPAG